MVGVCWALCELFGSKSGDVFAGVDKLHCVSVGFNGFLLLSQR
jgi:hypothetical protein